MGRDVAYQLGWWIFRFISSLSEFCALLLKVNEHAFGQMLGRILAMKDRQQDTHPACQFHRCWLLEWVITHPETNIWTEQTIGWFLCRCFFPFPSCCYFHVTFPAVSLKTSTPRTRPTQEILEMKKLWLPFKYHHLLTVVIMVNLLLLSYGSALTSSCLGPPVFFMVVTFFFGMMEVPFFCDIVFFCAVNCVMSCSESGRNRRSSTEAWK